VTSSTESGHLLRFPATLGGFDGAFAQLRRLLDGRVPDEALRYKIEVSFEEIAMNIVRHASATSDVQLRVTFSDREVELSFTDDGVPFDPREHPDPVAPSTIEEAKIGGLGLMLVRRFSNRMSYERTPDQLNHLTLTFPTR
jgi:anti-sigma regulatory factor (Ser/Thr protein kinase)